MSWPVSFLKASKYFSLVFLITSSGNEGGGGVLFHPLFSSQSLINCLSKLGCEASSRY